MNQFTKKTSPSGDGAETGRQTSPWIAGLIFKMALMMIIIFAAFFARVHLNDKTEQLAREKTLITKQIQERQTEIQSLRIQIANLRRWENINAKIREYNLALRSANPSQLRQMKRFDASVETPSNYGGDTRVADTSAGIPGSENGTIH